MLDNTTSSDTSVSPHRGVARENLGAAKHRPGAIFVALWLLNLGLSGWILFGQAERLTTGLLAVALLMTLLLSGIPVGFSLTLASIIGLIGLAGGDASIAWTTLQDNMYYGVANWTFAVAPLFVVMGVAMWLSGIADHAYVAARQWLGNLPGGLAIATSMAGAGLASVSGSTVGIVMSMSRMAAPEMFKVKYKPSIVTGTIATGGMLGQIIPPSVLLVIYASIAQTPVGPQLVAAIVPGAIIALLFALTILVWATLSPSVAPKIDMTGVTWRTRLRSLVNIAPIGLLMALVLGGILTGIFTVTESAALAALVALVLGALLRGKGTRGLRSIFAFFAETLRESVATIVGYFLVLVGALMMTSLIARSGIAQSASEWLLSLGLGRVALLLVLTVIFIVLGMFLESLPIILITLPILQPPLEAMDVDMIWFGVYMIVMMEIGAVSPPVGIISFIVHRVVQDPKTNLGQRVTLMDVFRGVMPFVLAALVAVIALILWPNMALWLPGLSSAT